MEAGLLDRADLVFALGWGEHKVRPYFLGRIICELSRRRGYLQSSVGPEEIFEETRG